MTKEELTRFLMPFEDCLEIYVEIRGEKTPLQSLTKYDWPKDGVGSIVLLPETKKLLPTREEQGYNWKDPCTNCEAYETPWGKEPCKSCCDHQHDPGWELKE